MLQNNISSHVVLSLPAISAVLLCCILICCLVLLHSRHTHTQSCERRPCSVWHGPHTSVMPPALSCFQKPGPCSAAISGGCICLSGAVVACALTHILHPACTLPAPFGLPQCCASTPCGQHTSCFFARAWAKSCGVHCSGLSAASGDMLPDTAAHCGDVLSAWQWTSLAYIHQN